MNVIGQVPVDAIHYMWNHICMQAMHLSYNYVGTTNIQL
jgi:hypothetical protein